MQSLLCEDAVTLLLKTPRRDRISAIPQEDRYYVGPYLSPTAIVHARPATNSRCQDFIKSVMVQAHLRIKYVYLNCPERMLTLVNP
jgi:hypothetical protein